MKYLENFIFANAVEQTVKMIHITRVRLSL
jgi:hypothetical protein